MADDTCDLCGSANLVWRKCKQVCLDCHAINRSCADLAASPELRSPRIGS